MSIDQLQSVRMMAIWPLVVGATAFFMVRLVLIVTAPDGKVRRGGVATCITIGIAAGIVALSISRHWDNGANYWLWFTVGLAALAVALLVTAAMLAAEDMAKDLTQ